MQKEQSSPLWLLLSSLISLQPVAHSLCCNNISGNQDPRRTCYDLFFPLIERTKPQRNAFFTILTARFPKSFANVQADYTKAEPSHPATLFSAPFLRSAVSLSSRQECQLVAVGKNTLAFIISQHTMEMRDASSIRHMK